MTTTPSEHPGPVTDGTDGGYDEFSPDTRTIHDGCGLDWLDHPGFLNGEPTCPDRQA